MLDMVLFVSTLLAQNWIVQFSRDIEKEEVVITCTRMYKDNSISIIHYCDFSSYVNWTELLDWVQDEYAHMKELIDRDDKGGESHG